MTGKRRADRPQGSTSSSAGSTTPRGDRPADTQPARTRTRASGGGSSSAAGASTVRRPAGSRPGTGGAGKSGAGKSGAGRSGGSGSGGSKGPANRSGGTGPGRGKKEEAKKPKRAWWKRLLLWSTTFVLVLALIGVGGFIYLYQTTDIPDPNAAFQTENTHIYYAGGEEEIGTFFTQNRESIDLADMPDSIQDAVVAAEDRTFWTNRGIDPKGILRAAFSNAQGNDTQGASTITQQYVKILYLSQEQTLTRKVREAILSLKIQRQLGKSEILEGYLNTIYFGRGAYGVEAASQAYFNHSAGDLTVAESAVLASVINNPTQFSPDSEEGLERLGDRYQYVLNGMLEAGDISQAEHDEAAAGLPEFPVIEQSDTYGGQNGHLLTLVRSELLSLGFTESEIDGGGLEVETTFTAEAMNAAAEGVAEEYPEDFLNYSDDPTVNAEDTLHVGVAMVEPSTGALVGFYGGQDFLDSQINWASAQVQPGSTFKAYAVAAALENGFSLRDTFTGNSPYEGVENQGDTDYGRVSLLTATRNSINTAFIQLTEELGTELDGDEAAGPQAILDTAEALGVPSNDGGDFGIPTASRGLDDNLAVSLGSGDVSPINMAAGYAAIANGGVYNPVHVVTKVTDANGEVAYEWEPESRRGVSEDVAADTSYALQQVVRSGSGTAALSLDRPAAGKTGTATNEDGDVSSSWFVGYTPQLATAVAYTRGDGRGKLDGWMPSYFGGTYPAETWTSVMELALEGTEEEDFPDPAWIRGDYDSPSESSGSNTGGGQSSSSAPPSTSETPTPTETEEPTPTEEPTVEPTVPTELPTLPTEIPTTVPTIAPNNRD